MKDSEIRNSDIPELDEAFFKNTKNVLPEPKAAVSIRLDSDALIWFKSQGGGAGSQIDRMLNGSLAQQA
jgi:uncharacterized protein (DUF4415 family)